MSNTNYGIRLKVWGDLACFTRPEMKVERVSYDVMTPSAARGVLEAIYWKPEITWVIDEIHILKPIRFTNVRRNEVKDKIPATKVKSAMKSGSGNLGMYADDSGNRQQRAATLLRDVAYVIVAHFEVKGGQDQPAKHLQMFKRRAGRGQYFHHPYLGTREFPADFELVEGELPESELAADGERDLGFMLHDIDFANDYTPRFFRAHLVGGVLKVPAFHSSETIA